MAVPANAAVRENRRLSTPCDLQRFSVIKALAAAEYSRRQFILNFSASRDTQLLVPGKKSDAVKAAEKGVALWFGQNGHHTVDAEFFRYKVDKRLWLIHVGDEPEFPFTFMRGKFAPPPHAAPPSDISSLDKSAAFTPGQEIDLRDGEILPLTDPAGSPKVQASRRQQQRQPAPSTPQTHSKRSTRHLESAEVSSDRKRSMSLNSLDDLKTPKSNQEKPPFFVRLGRSWSRRMSAASSS
ncbi:hypothetical protein C8A00DRAFT_16990 [Chaetomidium leptoderma]|uniref:Uncharacterized protein n=1 Tax=Chaetomidium leptoderma TaxID=669021 RepID=A0AAN6ZWR3_9PEZI|nr:hypothetical protein C8A00DRAFT_16990 [Chaetomidium leptoderma]